MSLGAARAERNSMDATTINAYLRKIAEASIQDAKNIGGWRFRIADYVSPGNYTMLGEWQPVTGFEVFPPGSTVMIETEWTFPRRIIHSPEKNDYLIIKVDDFEGLLSIDGIPYHGVDANRERIPVSPAFAGKKAKLSLELYNRKRAGILREKPMLLYSRYVTVDSRIDALYFDLRVAWESVPFVNGDFTRRELEKSIDEGLRYLDLSFEGAALAEAARATSAKLRERIARIGRGDPHGSIALVAHTHIDVAWLWQLKETVRKSSRTFSNVIRLMDEYPDFKFMCSQAQLFEYTRDNYPVLYEQIKKYVREGRWEITGPMWIESDCNLISGESLVRQMVYGSRFFEAEFGKRSEICWLPDTFGFPGNMPQILAKSGVKYFYTYKLHWQNINRFPYGMFIWRGIDGSEILAEVPRIESGYNAKLTPSEIRHAQDDNMQKGTADDILLTYGWGDGGGGPTREMMEYAPRLEKIPGMPACRRTSASDFFKNAESIRATLPVWNGELYLETHRGTYTSQARVKKLNRRCEQLLRDAEIFGVLSGMQGKGPDAAVLKAAWKDVLLLQFHDILPGSSIREVYDDAERTYAQVLTAVGKSLGESLRALAGQDDGITVFNGLSWTRDDVVAMALPREAAGEDAVVVYDSKGALVDSVVTRDGSGAKQLVFVVEGVPSLGSATYRLEWGTARDDSADRQIARTEPFEKGIKLETGRWRVDIGAAGTVTGLFDKKAGREVISRGKPGNDFRLFLDGPQHEDAWNIYPEYKSREIDPGWDNSVTLVENNSVRAVVRIKKRAGDAVIEQDIVLYARLPRIDFFTRVDWRMRHKVLRIAFPVEVLSPRATFEVGFGAVERTTHANNPWESAMFEVCGQRWVDLSESGYGVSLLNDSKYGFDITDGTISMTLLRGTDYPGEGADIGTHEFSYSLYPHEGDWRAGKTPRRGCEFNAPLLTVVAPEVSRAPRGGTGAGRSAVSFVSVDSPSAILDTLKPAEDGVGLIVRLYESCGGRGPARIATSFKIAKAVECNLMEETCGAVGSGDHGFSFFMTPYEVKTFRIMPL